MPDRQGGLRAREMTDLKVSVTQHRHAGSPPDADCNRRAAAGRAVAILGATGGAAFLALTPVVTGMMAIPVLGEWPTASEWFSIALISVGVYILSGGRLPAWRGQPV
jgi:hypothetical protein